MNRSVGSGAGAPTFHPSWCRLCGGALVSLLALACGAIDDPVFDAKLLMLSGEPVHVSEGAGVVSIPVRLKEPVGVDVIATFEVQGIEAQDSCADPDFTAASGELLFPAGTDEASMSLWIGDDDLPELDERLAISITALSGATLSGGASVTVVIEDDDREALLNAADYGVVPNTTQDMTSALQEALDRTAEAGRGVLLMAPGDYEIESVRLSAGTTLSARGAHWHRPANSTLGSHALYVAYDGDIDSLSTLIEGVSIDGRRELQGEYRDYERENDHLIAVDGGAQRPGQLRVSVEGVSVSSGTGDGVAVGPDSKASLCQIQANDIWRDAISLHGGRSTLKVRGFDATASEGTSGIWLDGNIPGYDGTRSVDVEIEDARLNTGDIEMEVSDASHVVFRRLSMTEPPFRVMAPDSTVEIIDSIIQLGIPSERHNNFTLAHDVRFVRSTIVSSERVDEEAQSEEMDRTFSTFSLRWTTEDQPEPPPGEQQLSLDSCELLLDDDIEASDTVYAVDNPNPGGAVIVHNCKLGPGFEDWFAPGCADCRIE